MRERKRGTSEKVTNKLAQAFGGGKAAGPVRTTGPGQIAARSAPAPGFICFIIADVAISQAEACATIPYFSSFIMPGTLHCCWRLLAAHP